MNDDGSFELIDDNGQPIVPALGSGIRREHLRLPTKMTPQTAMKAIREKLQDQLQKLKEKKDKRPNSPGSPDSSAPAAAEAPTRWRQDSADNVNTGSNSPLFESVMCSPLYFDSCAVL